MAAILKIGSRQSWSAGTWTARFAVRAICSFLPECDAGHLREYFVARQDGRNIDLSEFEGFEILMACS